MSGERMVRLTMTQEQYHALRHKLDRLPWTSSEEAAVRVLVAAFDAAPAGDAEPCRACRMACYDADGRPCGSCNGMGYVDAAPAPDPRFAQIRDLLAVWAGDGSKIGAAYAIASAAGAGERGDDG